MSNEKVVSSSLLSSRRHHNFDYVEIPVNDMVAAKAFYSNAFDWKFTDYGPRYSGIHRVGKLSHEIDSNNVNVDDGDVEIGGLCLVDSTSKVKNEGFEVSPMGPLMILYSNNLDETLAQVRTAPGGTIVKEPFAFPGGRRFHFSDPCGNEMAVWSQN